MIVELLSEYHLEFLSLTGGGIGSSESTHVKMPHCWKSHVAAHMLFLEHVQWHEYDSVFVKKLLNTNRNMRYGSRVECTRLTNPFDWLASYIQLYFRSAYLIG